MDQEKQLTSFRDGSGNENCPARLFLTHLSREPEMTPEELIGRDDLDLNDKLRQLHHRRREKSRDYMRVILRNAMCEEYYDWENPTETFFEFTERIDIPPVTKALLRKGLSVQEEHDAILIESIRCVDDAIQSQFEKRNANNPIYQSLIKGN